MKKKHLRKYIFFEIQTRLGDVGGDNIWRQSKVIDERTLFKSLFEMTRCPLSLSSVFFRIGSLKKKKVLIARISDRTAPRTSSYSHFLFIFNGAKFKKKILCKNNESKVWFQGENIFSPFVYFCLCWLKSYRHAFLIFSFCIPHYRKEKSSKRDGETNVFRYGNFCRNAVKKKYFINKRLGPEVHLQTWRRRKCWKSKTPVQPDDEDIYT